MWICELISTAMKRRGETEARRHGGGKTKQKFVGEVRGVEGGL
jgi:hypothetical protein